MIIDRKYQILAVNPCTGSIHTEKDSILLSAKDPGILPALGKYLEYWQRKGCDPNHLKSVELLMERIVEFQKKNGKKIPDMDDPCEVDRCIHGFL